MIKKLSEKTAGYIVRQDSAADYEVLAYGYELLYQETAVKLLNLLLAALFGIFPQVLVVMIVFHLLRRYAGGAHANSRVVCTITSTGILFGPALLFAKTSLQLHWAVLIGLFLLDLVFLLAYAPADTEIKPIQTPAKRKRVKRKSVAALLAVFLSAFLVHFATDGYADMMVVVATFVCLSTTPFFYRLMGCNKSLTLEVAA